MSYQFQKVSVLVVEDNQPMMEVTKALLLTFGVGNVLTAQNGEAGFKRFCESNPDIIIADWMMKPMDGIALTKRIRTDALSPNPYVPVILMTGFSEKRRVIQARDAGVTEFLVKPFHARDLYRRIAQLIERPRQFVRSEDFFGPDRRRQTAEIYTGPRRRESDGADAAQIEDQRARAQAMLENIRQEAGMEKGDRFDLVFVESQDHTEDD
jgi:two-component system, chemotaxis family, chemotaxis protein CheY